MKTTILISLLFFCIFSVWSQDPAQPEPTRQDPQPDSLIQFDFRLAPNSQGALEGSARVNLLWWDYLSSGVSFTVTNFTSVYDEYGGSTTSIESNKVLEFDIVKTRKDLLKLSWSDNSYIALNAGIGASIAWLNQEKYGHGDIQPLPGVFAYFSKQDIFYVKPLARAELEIALGFLNLRGFAGITPFDIITHTDGEFFFSTVGVKADYSIDAGSTELHCGGELLFTPSEDLEIKLGFNYTWYSGTAEAADAATGFSLKEIPYETDQYEVLGSLSFSLFGFRPKIGVSYVYYKFRPGDTIAVSYSSDRFRFSFGLVNN